MSLGVSREGEEQDPNGDGSLRTKVAFKEEERDFHSSCFSQEK